MHPLCYLHSRLYSRPPAQPLFRHPRRAIAAVLRRLLLVGLLLGSGAQAQLPGPVSQALHGAGIAPDNVALLVQPVDSQRPLLTHNAQQPMNPASLMKLLTTYAALDLLGPGYRWQTTLLADAPAAVDGNLPGNLYLRGGGDPRFALEHLSALLRQLRVRGITRIAGDIVLDRSAFAPASFDPAAFDNKPLRPYNVGANALLINFQALRFTLQGEREQPRVLLETPLAGIQLNNRLRSIGGPCGSDWQDRITLTQREHLLEIGGTYAQQCGERLLHLAPLAAETHDRALLLALWQELGGQLNGQVRDGTTPATAQTLLVHRSPPLAEVIRDINKFSNNVMARQLFLSLGNGNDSAPAHSERAVQRVSTWLRERGLNFPELVLDNGAGLSRSERISASSMNRLLLDAWRHPAMPEFIASLPLVGIDGTMRRRLQQSAVHGRAHVKTGSLNGVRSIAGYALDARGQRLAVTFLINDPRAEAAGPAIDALLTWVAGQS